MPYVLRNERTGEIAAAMLRNSYDFAYFGVKWWDRADVAAEERTSFLAQWQYADEPLWHVIEVEEAKVKSCNVKLKNSAAYMVVMDDSGSLRASLRDEP